MKNYLTNQLLELLKIANNSENSENILKYFKVAFRKLSYDTKKLEDSYDNLKHRFFEIYEKLESTDYELNEKVNDLNNISTYLNLILKKISQGIIVVNNYGQIITFNDSAETILDIFQEKIRFQNYWQFFSDDYFGFSMKNALNYSLSKNLNYIQIKTFKKNVKEIEISTSFIHEAYQYKGLIILLKDVTKIKKLQQIASRNDRLKELGEMASRVAHEIKNPLGGIRGYGSLLVKDLQNFPQMQEIARKIIDGTKSLERLVSNVLHFSRPILVQRKKIDINKLIRDLVKTFKINPSFEKNVQIELNLVSKEFFINVDEELFKSMLLNLIVNGYQSIENLGKISISTIKNNDQCIITISDTGKGIEANDIDNIFSPFFTTKKTGNGLGLSEAYKIVQAHFGQITVKSEILNGTTFTTIIPTKGFEKCF